MYFIKNDIYICEIIKMHANKSCGCKGIRRCLICEKNGDVLAESLKTEENQYVYNFCSYCNLCWPNDKATASLCDYPLFLGKIKVITEFCSEEEESTLISFIDQIPWMPSQSGRRKQDFGPKVNFKKKKVKIGEFKGFPGFTESVIKKLQNFPELSDFDPVELCNLEYTPERGSSIDPHVDDFWLWGERLVTVNLNSTTILTLVPCSEIVCNCLLEASNSPFQTSSKHSDKIDACKHLFQNDNFINQSLNCLPKNENIDTATRSFNCFKISNTNASENEALKSNYPDYETNVDEKMYSETKAKHINCKIADSGINSICNLFRTSSSDCKICVRIILPPRSLFILSGCARYNWFHEIKRQDIISRRLAMTFRELSANYLDENKESQSGKDLLKIAKNFYVL